MNRTARLLKPYLLLAALGLPSAAQSFSEQWAAFTPQGSSARAVGIGGAFTAVADDATAVSFNPAGLSQLLKPEVSFVGMRSERQMHNLAQGTLADQTRFTLRSDSLSDRQNEPLFVSMTFPWKAWDRNFVVQLSAQRLFELEAHSNTDTAVFLDGIKDTGGLERLDTTGSINMRSLAFAAELTPRVLLGVSLNSWRGSWETVRRNRIARGQDLAILLTDYRTEEVADIRGVNWTLGGMWRFEYVTFAAVYRTPFDADYTSRQRVDIFAPTPDAEASADRFAIRWPESLALGLALRPHPRWLVAADWVRTEWSKARFRIPGSSLDGRNFFDPEHPALVHDAAVRRIGVEFIPAAFRGVLVPVRVGYFHEPQFLVDGGTGQQRVAKGWTLGTGMRFRNAWADVAYKSTRGDRTISLPINQQGTITATPTREEVRERRLYVSFTVQFNQDLQRQLLKWLFVEG